MGFDASITLIVLCATLVALVRQWAAVEVLMMGALTLLMALGVMGPREALAGFGSTAVFAIAGLLVVAAGVRRTGMLTGIADNLLGGKSRPASLGRLLLPVAALSAFLNNTPIVAMFAPAVLDWCKRNNRPPSSMLMPLSYATILGGMCTLIGTSTTLIIDELMRARGMDGLGMFEVSVVGIPAALLGLAVIVWLAPRVLPDRRDPVTGFLDERREFLVEMLVEASSPLVGQAVDDAGLRNLPGLFLIGIERDGHFMSPVSPVARLVADDRLVLAGIASTVVDLRRFPGLSPAPDTHYDPEAAERRSHMFEVVVASNSPLVGSTIKEFGFRSRYDAAVIAVHRAGQRLATKLGDVEVRPGDTLMLEAAERFAGRWGDSVHFSLVSQVNAEPSPRRSKSTWAIAVVAALVGLVTFGWMPMVVAAMLAAASMVVGGLLDARDVQKAVNLPVLVTVAAAMGLGRALEVSGAAAILARPIEWVSLHFGELALLGTCFVITAIFASLISNVGAAAILFPVVLTAAAVADINPRPLAITVAIAATASFLTPTGYQTNLMVFGPGGYRFTDFARLGAPLLVVVGVVTLAVVPWVWPL